MTSQITKTERTELTRLIKLNTKVLRNEIACREAEMLSEISVRLAERAREDDKAADGFQEACRELTQEANAKLDELLKQHGELFSGGRWRDPGRFHAPRAYRVPEDREQLRKAAEHRIRLQARQARAALDRAEADLLRDLHVEALETEAAREFLTRMPTLDGLLPTSALELEAQPA